MSETPADDDLADQLDSQVEALLEPLDRVEERPLSEHPAAYEQVHASLREVLVGETAAPSAR